MSEAWIAVDDYIAGHLLGNAVADVELLLVLLARIAVAEVDHDFCLQAGLAELHGRRLDALGVVVRLLAAAQDHMAVVIAPSLDDRGMTTFGH